MNPFPDSKSSTGLDANIAGVLCYLLLWVTGIIFLLVEKDSKFVRFHALQSLFFFGGITALFLVFSFFSVFLFPWVIAFMLVPLLQIAAFILWVVLMIKAYQGELWKLPWVGDLALQYA